MATSAIGRALRADVAFEHLFCEGGLAAVNQRLDIPQRKAERARNRMVFHVVEVPQGQHRARPFGKLRERFAHLAFGFGPQQAASRVGFERKVGESILERLLFGQLLSLWAALRLAEVRANDIARDLVDPGRESAELWVECT